MLLFRAGIQKLSGEDGHILVYARTLPLAKRKVNSYLSEHRSDLSALERTKVCEALKMEHHRDTVAVVSADV